MLFNFVVLYNFKNAVIYFHCLEEYFSVIHFHFRVFVLSKIGKITMWEENRDNTFIPCILSLSRSPPLITDMALFRWG